MKRVLVLVALAGCDRWHTCEERADWTIAFSRIDGGEPTEGAQGVLSRARDGTLILVINDDATNVQFGNLRVGGGVIARIGADGTMLGLLPAPQINSARLAVTSDADGNVFVAQGTTVWSYSSALLLRWTTQVSAGNLTDPLLAASSDGHLAVVARGSGSDVLVYYDPSGSELWTLSLAAAASAVSLDDSGEVHVYVRNGSSFEHRRYAAADSMLLGTTKLERPPLVLASDRSYVAADHYDTGTIVIARYSADGTRRWERELDYGYFVQLADNGDVLAPISRDPEAGSTLRLVRLDADNGDTRSDDTMCTDLDIIGSDAHYYYGMGRQGVPSVGIARFRL